MKKKIIFSAGGTGGHILPAINLMKHFSEKGYEVVIVTDSRGKKYIDRYSDFKFYIISASTTTNKNYYRKFISIFTICYSILKSFKILNLEKPNLVFGLGGYVSFPLCFTSKLFSIPLFIYENNMVLGRANRYLALFAKKIKDEEMLGVGAIASKDASEIYNLEILNESIQTIKNNKTRFVILEKKKTNDEFNKAALKFILDHKRGSLASVLNLMSDCSLNLTKIQSLPVIQTPGKYAFFVDITFNSVDNYNKAKKIIEIMAQEFKVLGEYKIKEL